MNSVVRAHRHADDRIHHVCSAYDRDAELSNTPVGRQRARCRGRRSRGRPQRPVESCRPRTAVLNALRTRRRALLDFAAQRLRNRRLDARGPVGERHRLGRGVRLVTRGEIWFADTSPRCARPAWTKCASGPPTHSDAVAVKGSVRPRGAPRSAPPTSWPPTSTRPFAPRPQAAGPPRPRCVRCDTSERPANRAVGSVRR